MSQIIYPFFICVFMFNAIDSFGQGQWVMDKNQNGIKVYTRDERNSDFKSFKAQTLVEATTSEIIRVMQDADGYVEWYAFTKTSRLVGRQGNEEYHYIETIFPWPYQNRDMVYRMSISTLDQGVVKIDLVGFPNRIPERDGIVRMQKAVGYILLTPTDEKTEITYVFHSEPGNSIPAWLANKSIAELPIRTLSGLKTILETDETETF